ncbi:hypothetical protein SASPL_146026 [Salvia splendens]|uniref:Pectinesterase inhibitor domain-containing protein n=1 Tax=Salvia splendens TaxID=180675 RepID=A0A8X8Z8K4_SALSN|nr:hypothetical protein SASPL_146026 [Salvia splendens]
MREGPGRPILCVAPAAARVRIFGRERLGDGDGGRERDPRARGCAAEVHGRRGRAGAVDPRGAGHAGPLGRCLGNVGNGEGALEVALQTLNDTRGAERDEVLKMIGGAAAELSACAESLKKHAHDDVIRKAFELTEDSVKACFVARAILT